MALGKADLTAATNTTLYTVPAGKTAACSVNFCNRFATPVTVRLAISATGTPDNSEWLFYDVVITGNGSLERSGLVVQAGELVVVYAASAGVSAMCYGYEE